MKRGLTLVEVVVAMGIFMITITIIVGAYVSISRMRSMTSIMNESQQKTRIALEMITRLSRQAEKVAVLDRGARIDLYFDMETAISATSFRIREGDLFLHHCEEFDRFVCDDWGEGQSLYRGISLVRDRHGDERQSRFAKRATTPPVLDVNLYGEIVGINQNPHFSDRINIESSVILESLK